LTGYGNALSPAVANGIVYFPSGDYNLYALDASTGTLKWNHTVQNGFSPSTPSIANGLVYIGDTSGNVSGFDAGTGVLKWTVKPSYNGQNTPVIANGKVFVTDHNYYVYALGAGGSGTTVSGTPASGTTPTPKAAGEWLGLSVIGLGIAYVTARKKYFK
jgi:outer membrane protein assembly factor BamB